MSLYLPLLFSLLVLEMAILFVLVLPLPNRIRKGFCATFNNLMKTQQFKTVVVILSIIVGLLFVDSWQRAQIPVSLYRHKRYDREADIENSSVTSIQVLASRAYNQRNVYISGFILYFMVGIPTVMSIVRRLVKYQDLINAQKKGEIASTSSVSDTVDDETKKLQDELKLKETSLVGLKKQIENLNKFYDNANKPNDENPSKLTEAKKAE